MYHHYVWVREANYNEHKHINQCIPRLSQIFQLVYMTHSHVTIVWALWIISSFQPHSSVILCEDNISIFSSCSRHVVFRSKFSLSLRKHGKVLRSCQHFGFETMNHTNTSASNSKVMPSAYFHVNSCDSWIKCYHHDIPKVHLVSRDCSDQR